MVDNFLFGYGSLICAESRGKTGESGIAIPVRVKGIERQWNLVVEKATAVGAISNLESQCNGVLVEVSESELPKFDEREAGYTRKPITRENIECEGELPEGNYWVYVADTPGNPDIEHPLIQSYIDVILTGCLDISEEFAREFITTTKGWNNPWINDRKTPRYPRAMTEVPYAQKIDSMLEKLVPEAYKFREDISGRRE